MSANNNAPIPVITTDGLQALTPSLIFARRLVAGPNYRKAKRAIAGVGKHERRTWWKGGLFIIRDVYVGRVFVCCEYAARNPNGSRKWLPCAEGVEFAAITPWRRRRVH